MKFTTFSINGPILISPEFWDDNQAYSVSQFNLEMFVGLVGEDVVFVQENQSLSYRSGTIRGLHYQSPPYSQGKLIQCIKGQILDVVVDARLKSKSYGDHICVELSSENKKQLWVPAGFLHGFSTQSNNSVVSYKVTNYFSQEHEGNIKYDDPALGINWNIKGTPIISERDLQAQLFSNWKTPFLI